MFITDKMAWFISKSLRVTLLLGNPSEDFIKTIKYQFVIIIYKINIICECYPVLNHADKIEKVGFAFRKEIIDLPLPNGGKNETSVCNSVICYFDFSILFF